LKTYLKTDFPVADVRRFLEPGPIVLVSSLDKTKTNIMTMGWHMVMEFTPSRIGCIISSANHSFAMIRNSRACVINIPTVDMATTVVDIGNCSGRDVDKFEKFGLTPEPGVAVRAPSIRECYASFECRLADAKMIATYNMFIFEVMRAQVAVSPKFPKTMHYRGDGDFMISGAETRKWRKRFRPEML
jgi:flavin reductase (DIM6/NTAB) family NADH-FMN oxidoreductase RutF